MPELVNRSPTPDHLTQGRHRTKTDFPFQRRVRTLVRLSRGIPHSDLEDLLIAVIDTRHEIARAANGG